MKDQNHVYQTIVQITNGAVTQWTNELSSRRSLREVDEYLQQCGGQDSIFVQVNSIYYVEKSGWETITIVYAYRFLPNRIEVTCGSKTYVRYPEIDRWFGKPEADAQVIWEVPVKILGTPNDDLLDLFLVEVDGQKKQANRYALQGLKGLSW